MFSSSVDILNLVLAVCIALLTLFLCWSLYYFIASARRINKIAKQIELGVSKAEEVISLIKDKIKGGSAYLMILAEVAKQAMEFAKNNRWTAKKEKEKTKTTKKK